MEITCNACGSAFTAARADARYCSNRCRVSAHRQRHNPPAPKRRRPPLTDSFHRRVRDSENAVEGLRRATADDRFPKHREEFKANYIHGIDRIIGDLEHVRARLTDSQTPVEEDWRAKPKPRRSDKRRSHSNMDMLRKLDGETFDGILLAFDVIEREGFDETVEGEEARTVADQLLQKLGRLRGIVRLARAR